MNAGGSIYTGCLDALTWRFRTRMSRAEALLWAELKGRRLRGLRFDRRLRVDRYVVDFYCSELRLAVDVVPAPGDARGGPDDRTVRLRLCGITFLPFTEEEVLRDLDAVVSRIGQAIRYLPWK